MVKSIPGNYASRVITKQALRIHDKLTLLYYLLKNDFRLIKILRQSITDLFFQPKICWKAVGRNLTFAIVESGTFLTAPASFISAGKYNKYILAFLCSAVGRYYIYKNSDTTGAGDIMLNIQSLIRFPIPKSSRATSIVDKVDELSRHNEIAIQDEIDEEIFSMYGFNEDEILEIMKV